MEKDEIFKEEVKRAIKEFLDEEDCLEKWVDKEKVGPVSAINDAWLDDGRENLRCSRCGYESTGAPDRCPECGVVLSGIRNIANPFLKELKKKRGC